MEKFFSYNLNHEWFSSSQERTSSFFRRPRFHNMSSLGNKTLWCVKDADFRLWSTASNGIGMRKTNCWIGKGPTWSFIYWHFYRIGWKCIDGNEKVEVQKEKSNGENLPNTFVPGRNLILLSFVAARAWQLEIENVVTGVCQTDYSGYPDWRKNSIEALQLAPNLGMERQFVLHTPLMLLDKAQTIIMAKDLGAL